MAVLGQAEPETKDDIIAGTMNIDFGTRTNIDTSGDLKKGSPAMGAADKYSINLNVAETTAIGELGIDSLGMLEIIGSLERELMRRRRREEPAAVLASRLLVDLTGAELTGAVDVHRGLPDRPVVAFRPERGGLDVPEAPGFGVELDRGPGELLQRLEHLRAAGVRDVPLDRVREICLALPEVTEKLSHGAPTWFAGKKTFVMFLDDHHGDGILVDPQFGTGAVKVTRPVDVPTGRLVMRY